MNEALYNGRLYYRTNEFVPGRETVVFMHGLSGSASAWVLYENFFFEKFNVVTFDLRGHGKSNKPSKMGDYSISNFSRDLRELLSHLRIDACTLVAHSFGTLIALDFSLNNPALVHKLVLLSPSFNPGAPIMAKIVEPFVFASALLSPLPFNPAPKTHIDYSKYVGSGDWNIPRMIADVSNTGLRPYLYATLSTYHFNVEKRLGELMMPTLIVHGTKDSIFSVENSRTMQKKLPDARLVEIPGADHIIVLNQFEEVSRAIDGFLCDKM